MMKAASSSEVPLINFRLKWDCIREDFNLYEQCGETLKSRIYYTYFPCAFFMIFYVHWPKCLFIAVALTLFLTCCSCLSLCHPLGCFPLGLV
jgi:hypothetical protein